MSVRTDELKTSTPPSAPAPAAAPPAAMPERAKMVGWYDPLQLARTGVEVAVSTVFGRHSDQRQIEALTSGDSDVYDYTYHYTDDGADRCEPDETRPRDSIWIDYVGDVGDGFNSTYAVAYHLAQPMSELAYRDPRTGEERVAETRRGELLIFGGDQVYPTASRDEYERRLIQPYACALRHTEPPCPHVFAIPGNHDWYDSLVSFTRYFNSARRWFGGWRTRQDRSYFALKLPHNWWLLGTDVQLGSDIDRAQMEYFERAADRMKAEEARTGQPARIILCNAEPDWIFAAQYKGLDPTYSEKNLRVLEKRLGRKVAVFIAGDLHHYRRHEATDGSGTQKITAGGGGAFLHPTHPGRRGLDLSTIADDDGRQFRMTKCFPPAEESRRLTWRNLFFPYLRDNASRTFGFVTALLYLVMTLHHVGDVGAVERTYQFGSLVGLALNSLLSSPATLFCVTLTVLGFFFFTDTHSRLHRFVMGGLHAFAHVLAAFAVAMVSLLLVSGFTSDAWVAPFSLGVYDFTFDPRMLVAALFIMAGGFVVGPLILGLYLIVSLNYFGRHSNEAFSSLAVEDWKHFLRMHINERGDLTIYPVGLRRVPRAWRPRDGGAGPEVVPDDAAASAPELIEPPVVLRGAPSQTGVTVASANGHAPSGNGARADA
jgi:hypothetical protein